MSVISPELLEKFKLCVYEKSDLHFSSKKLAFLETRIRERLVRSGLRDFEAYYERLMQSPAEVYALIEDLTTNQTFFYRNAAQFEALEKRVIPAIVESRNREVVSSWGKGPDRPPGRHPAMTVRVWSAGCATGEEAYSIAFSMLRAVRYHRAWDLDVLATDIKRDALETARLGVYPDEALRALPADIRESFMERVPDGWSVKDEARRLVRFFAANIKDVTGAGGELTLSLEDMDGRVTTLDVRGRFDVIFCRNVMIYFDHTGQQRLVDALYGCLRPGGYLFTGDSEPLHLFSHGFTRADDDGSLYYTKPE